MQHPLSSVNADRYNLGKKKGKDDFVGNLFPLGKGSRQYPHTERHTQKHIDRIKAVHGTVLFFQKGYAVNQCQRDAAVEICPQPDLKGIIDDNGGEQDEEEQQYMVYLSAAQICNTYEKQNGNEHAAQIDQIIAPDGVFQRRGRADRVVAEISDRDRHKKEQIIGYFLLLPDFYQEHEKDYGHDKRDTIKRNNHRKYPSF